jgi:hypothetical protein
MPKPGTPNTLLPGLGGPSAAPQNAFAGSSQAQQAVGQGLVGSLTANTKPFNPSTVGSPLTAAAPSTGINWGAINLNTPAKNTPGLATNINPAITAPVSQAAPQYSAVGNGTQLLAPPSQVGSPLPGGGMAVPGVGIVGAPTPPAQTPTSGQPPVPPNQTQFGRIVGSLANTAQQGSQTGQQITSNLANTSQAGSPAAQYYTGQLANYGGGNLAIGQEAQQIGQQTQQNISNAENAGGQQYTGYMTGGGGPIGLGRAGAVQNALSNYVQGQSAAEQAALAGTSQQLTAQGQAATAANEAASQSYSGQGLIQSGLASAGGLAQNQQSLTQSGLASAGGLAQPSSTSYGQTSYDPTTGTYSNNGNLPASTLQQYAQMAANGQYSAIPSSVTGNAELSAQINSAAQQINPNYSPITSAAQGAAAASNVQTAGTAQTSTAASGYQQAVQTYQNMNTVYSTADSQATNLVNDLASTGINSSNSQDYNQAINSLSNRLGSTAITKISTDIQELQNTYSNLLSTGGGTPTGQEQQALSILNPNSSAAQINQAIQSLQAAAYPKLLAQYQQAQTYQSSLSSGGSSSSSAAPAGFAWNP